MSFAVETTFVKATSEVFITSLKTAKDMSSNSSTTKPFNLSSNDPVHRLCGITLLLNRGYFSRFSYNQDAEMKVRFKHLFLTNLLQKPSRLVHTCDATANAGEYTCELPQCQYRKPRHKKWKMFHFLALVVASLSSHLRLRLHFTRVNRDNSSANFENDFDYACVS